MANEAVKIEHGVKNARSYTCADGTSISRGTLLKLTDPNTASATAVSGVVLVQFAGIAAADKIANDGSTTISCWTDGIFDLKAGTDTITAGDLVMISGANLIQRALNGAQLSGAIVGKALETASASEVIRVAVGSIV